MTKSVVTFLVCFKTSTICQETLASKRSGAGLGGEPMRLGNVLRTGIPLATVAWTRTLGGR